MKKQQYIYLIFSHTTNRMGEMIRTITQYDFNHVSLSLSENLSEIYSFARRHQDTPFFGGFVCESADRFNNDNGIANIKVCEIPVTPRQYRIAVNYINKIHREKEKYLYNMFSAASVPFKYRVRIDRAYTCVEFAVSVLRRAGVMRSLCIPRFCSIKQLDDLYSDLVIYQGEFPENVGSPAQADEYLQKTPVHNRVQFTVKCNARLFGRLCRKLWGKLTI